MNPITQALAASPDLFPASLDVGSNMVTLWRLSQADYEKAAFLDGRIAAGKPSRQLSLLEMASAVAATNLRESCDFIFHVGHVGSTLLSRLLGKHPALFSVREPDVLRTLSLISDRNRRDPYLSPFLKLFSRTYEPRARAVVKATSFVSEIAVDLLARSYAPRALAIGVSREVYLATIFGGENAPAEARALAPMRSMRINARLSTELSPDKLTEGEIVALGWLCESLCLSEAKLRAGERLLPIDFEDFLAHPAEILTDTFAHLDVGVSESDIVAILASDDMHSYSKATEYKYSSETRRTVLSESRARCGREIRQGLQWIDGIARENPAVENAFSLFG